MQKDELLEFFEGIRAEEDLQRMVNDRLREGLYLEFKQKQDSRSGQLSDGDKTHFSKALSGFSNSDGGVLIFGIETHKKDESAKELKPINEIDEFIKSLKKVMINAVQPFVDGVLVEKIETQQAATMGYAKCLIPASDKTPHRAMLADREYFKRSVEGFYRLEHFDLEDMFGRRQKPLLVLKVEIKDDAGQDKSIRELHFAFLNEGRHIARYYGFVGSFDANVSFVALKNQLKDISSLNNGRPTISYENNVGVIHPNGILYNMGFLTFKKKNHPGKVVGVIDYYCENMMPRRLSLEFE